MVGLLEEYRFDVIWEYNKNTSEHKVTGTLINTLTGKTEYIENIEMVRTYSRIFKNSDIR